MKYKHENANYAQMDASRDDISEPRFPYNSIFILFLIIFWT